MTSMMNASNSSLLVSSSSTNGSAPMFCSEETMFETAVKLLAYSLVLIISLIGNIRVMLLILGSAYMRRRTINLLVVNMALSDLLLSVFAIPRTLSDIATDDARWFVNGNLGGALCKLNIFVQDVSIAVSIESLVLIAFDRFCAVMYPIRRAAHSRFRIVLVPMTWLIACAIHSPTFVIYRLVHEGEKIYCEHVWSEDYEEHMRIARTHYLVMFVLFVAIPFVLLTVLYSSIVCKFYQRGYFLRTSLTARRLSARKQREHNVLKMAVVILIAFAVCWAPFNIYVFLVVFVWSRMSMDCSQKAFIFFATFLTYANSAVNPGIYHFFSKNFRRVSKRNYSARQRSMPSFSAFVPFCCRVKLRTLRSRKRDPPVNVHKLEFIAAL